MIKMECPYCDCIEYRLTNELSSNRSGYVQNTITYQCESCKGYFISIVKKGYQFYEKR